MARASRSEGVRGGAWEKAEGDGLLICLKNLKKIPGCRIHRSWKKSPRPFVVSKIRLDHVMSDSSLFLTSHVL